MDRPAAVASADIDGDGTEDLVFTGPGGQTYLQRGLGLGEFGPATLLIESAGPSASIFALDIDGDGDVEIVRGGQLFTPIAGRGYGLVSGPTLFADSESQIIDIDGDGVLDVFSAPQFWQRGLGGLAFAPSARLLDVLSSGTAGALVDLNGDGLLDLVLAQSNSQLPPLAVYPGTGSIPFASAGAIPISTTGFPTSSTDSITVLDGDLDGDPDLVFGASGSVSAPGSNSGLVYVENLGALAFGADAAIETGVRFLLVRGADYDGDGQSDLVANTSDSSQGSSLVTYRGLGGGSFGPANVIEESVVTLDLLPKDVDGDGVDELIHVRDRSRAELLDLEVTGSVSSQPLNEVLSVAAVVDVDQDGLPDLVAVAEEPARVVWKRRRVDGSYGRAIEIVAPLAGQSEVITNVAAGDMDGDGLVDLVTLRSVNTDTVLLSRALPGGGFASPLPIADVTTAFFGSFALTSVVVSDIDQDQDLDIFAVSGSSGEVFTVANLGGGSFGAPNVASPLQSNEEDPVLADIDGDGLLDIAHPFPNDVQWRRALGDGTFAPRETLLGLRVGSAAFADRTGDGIPELVVTSSLAKGGSILGVISSGPAQFAGAFSIVESASAISVSLVDLTLDGIPELIATLRSTQSADRFTVLTGGDSIFGFGPDITPNLPSGSAAEFIASIVPLDLDGDGDLDLVLNLLSSSSPVIVENLTFDELGVPYCGPAVVNSTGATGEVGAFGAASVLLNQVELRASSLPPGATGFFITSLTTGFVTGLPNSVGNLCVGGQIGRFVGPGQIGSVDSSGSLVLPLDLGAFPSPTQGSVPVQSGQTWNFQAWHRDTIQGQGTSNFTSGLSVTFL